METLSSSSKRLSSLAHSGSFNRNNQHDRMLRQAVYNTGANVFVVLAGLGVVALYWVLESFFRPLMWAMLCGAFLHPFKYQVTKNIKSWLGGLKEAGTPIALGVFLIPIDLLDSASENLIQALQRRWRVIVLVTGVFLALYITYHQAPMDAKQFSSFVWSVVIAFSNFIGFFSFRWVCSILIAYLIAVVKLWSPENKNMLSYFSIPIWLLILFCIIANAGPFRLPLAVAIIVLMGVGLYTDSAKPKPREPCSHASSEEREEVSNYPLIAADVSLAQQWESFSTMLMSSMNFSSTLEDSSTDTIQPTDHEDDGEEPETAEKTSGEQDGVDDLPASGSKVRFNSTSSCASSDNETRSAAMPDVSGAGTAELSAPHSQAGVVDMTPPGITSEILESASADRAPLSPQLSKESQTSTASSGTSRKKRRRSDKCFIFLFWAIALVMLWSNVWLILLPLISFAFRLIKYIAEWIRWFVTTGYQERFSDELEPAREWLGQRLDVIIPMPVRGMIKFVLKGDNKVVDILLISADTFISIMLILLLLVGFVLLSVFMCFQVQKEGIHLITVTSNLVQNNTMQPQWLTDVLRDGGMNETGGGIHSSLDPMIKNVYLFGRRYIVDQIGERITHERSRLLLETELVGIWDSLYESWVTKNTTMLAKPNYNGALFSHIRDGGVDFMWKNLSVNITGIVNFVRENIGIFQSVIESIWVLLKGNVNLAFTLLISLLQIILGGSTAILNSILSLIVFFTTLFYLLSTSSNDYKPVEWISKLTVAKTGSKFAQAVEDGIGGVFAASLKMAAFYGVYTWLTHTVFGINIVFLPAVFAAILGAIPFVGTYWAALPAILELSFIHKEVFLAVLLATFHVLPTFVVDTALYSDIRGGGHPYLTGLAIAGGIYCFGLQGAIVGPVLLCCIIVAMNLYSAVINPDTPITPLTPGSQTLLGRSQSDHRAHIKRSVSNCEL